MPFLNSQKGKLKGFENWKGLQGMGVGAYKHLNLVIRDISKNISTFLILLIKLNKSFTYTFLIVSLW